MLSSASSLDDIVNFLRRAHCSKAESVEVLMEVGVEYKRAKLAVHNSETWQDVKERDEQLHADLEQGLPDDRGSGSNDP